MARVTISSNNLFPGPRGAQGPAGPAGGPEGPQGPQGPQGNVGPQGPEGIQGPAGPTGAGGAQGPKGETGNKGDKGDTGAGVVVGGTTGQVLSKINSTDYNTQWTTPLSSLPVFPYVSGRFYRSPNTPSVTNFTITNNLTYFIPFYVFESNTFDRISFTTGATFSGSGSVRLGIYNNSGGSPSTVLLDAGTATPSAASQVNSITISQSLSAGWYWLAFNSITAATVNNFVMLGQSTGWVPSNLGTLANANNSYTGYSQTVNASSGFSTATSLNLTNLPTAIVLRSA
jgi:hypothetical protein